MTPTPTNTKAEGSGTDATAPIVYRELVTTALQCVIFGEADDKITPFVAASDIGSRRIQFAVTSPLLSKPSANVLRSSVVNESWKLPRVEPGPRTPPTDIVNVKSTSTLDNGTPSTANSLSKKLPSLKSPGPPVGRTGRSLSTSILNPVMPNPIFETVS